MVRLRKQAQGAINRLTEANFMSILDDIENLYQRNVRQHVTSTVVDLLLTSICSPTSLSDTFTILLAGFVAAVYKIIGVDVGAQFIQGAVDLFDKHYVCAANNNSGKETSNLISFLAGLYNFHVIGSKLIFDYLRLFLDTFSELNTELILKIIRTSGSQLRQEDQSSLKDIIKILRPPVAKLGNENVSVRTMFMIDMINDLRNNRVKTGLPASVVTSEHTIRMKKILGTLSNRYIKSSEPLHVCLDNIRESNKKGKWWLIGANSVGKEKHSDDNKNAAVSTSHDAGNRISGGSEGDVSDFIRLSQEQRMNTDIRQAIFITMISASDFQDAYYRLMKLKLKKTQELEIPKVLIHCSSAENNYNPYYTLVAKTLCRHRSLKRAFRFSLWNIFKKLGENYSEDETAEDDDDRNSLDMRQLVNLAKMFGSLIADGNLNLNVLKYLNFKFLKPKTKVFTEVLLITVLLQSQANIELGRDEISVTNIISNIKDTPQVAEGLYYFMKRVVSKTDISGGKAEMETIRWGCKIAAGVLREIIAGCDDSTRAL
jgi:nucleolar MIF4G domain-containing protein 1